MAGVTRWLLLCAVVLLGSAAGCRTTVGNYFANRGRDFGDVFALQVTGAVGVGVMARGGGLVEGGGGFGVHDKMWGAGWVYGKGNLGPLGGSSSGRRSGDLWVGILGVEYPNIEQGMGRSSNRIQRFPLFPFITTNINSKWIWEMEDDPLVDYYRIHAYDVELVAYLGVIYVRAGISLGELFDFFAGWFGYDPAGDDTPIPGERNPLDDLR